MQISRIRLSDKTSRALLRATPSAAIEHSSELIGCPISMFLTTSCVCLELRSLPSTGVTRLQRYYEPLRHPKAPGLSLAGVRLVIPAPRLGASRVACAFLVCMLSLLPRRSDWECSLLGSPAVSVFPERVIGSTCATTFSRIAQRSHYITACTLAESPYVTPLHQRLQPLRYLHDCSGYFRLERLPGGIRTRWKSAAFARRTPIAAVHASRYA